MSHALPLRLDRPSLRSRPWSEVTRLSDGWISLQLSGRLPEDWSLGLCRSLAARGVSLQRGYARRIEGDVWLAELMLEETAGRLGPTDFFALCAEPAPAVPGEPRILDFDLSESQVHGGSLILEVDAWDAVGLLAAVLRRVEAAGLVPAELLLETEEDCAFHHLVLTGRAPGPPGWPEQRALALGLAGLLQGR